MTLLINPEKARLVKPSGEVVEIVAQFGPGVVITEHTASPIDEGDVFERELPNGAFDRREVVDANFYGMGTGLPAHYQCKVNKMSALPRATNRKNVGNKVFVVYGHDEEAKEALYRLLLAVRLDVLSWDHAKALGQGAQSNHEIIRNGIDHADAVIVLFTPDEVAERGTHLGGAPHRRHQPRPNVLFEAGWAFGANRNKTILVEVAMTHGVSDIDGINSVRMTGVASLNSLMNDLEAIGCSVDRRDSSWNDVSRYPGLFGEPPDMPPPDEVSTAASMPEIVQGQLTLKRRR